MLGRNIDQSAGGQVLPPEYVAEVAQLARQRGLALHLDGARLFNAATANAARRGTDVYQEARELASHFDSVSVCLSKGLGAPVGSLVLGIVLAGTAYLATHYYWRRWVRRNWRKRQERRRQRNPHS